MKGNKVFDFLFRKQYVIAGCLVLFAGVGMTTLYNYNQKQEQDRLKQEIAQQEQYIVEETQMENVSSVVLPKKQIENEAAEKVTEIVDESMMLEDVKILVDGTAEQETEIEINTEKETVTDVAVPAPSLHFSVEEGLIWPMDGNVIMNYSMDSTIYHATLDQYKCNPAIIIAGEVNNKVYSAAKGKIVDISQNEVTGTTVTVDLGDGYQAIYGQLKELHFSKGDYLEAGHVIGYVNEPTKYYSVEGSNLYFELQKDGEPIDPIVFFE